jgi:hypothetical protein
MTQHRSVPPVTEELRARARSAPGTWLYAVDPAYDPDGRVPPEAIVGVWRVDDRGEIGDTFQHNPNYKPSARALELPEPTDPVDAAIQAAATGRGDDGQVAAALLAARLQVPEGAGGQLLTVPTDDGPAVRAYSAPAHADRSGWQRWRAVSGRELAAGLPPGHDVLVNPESSASVRIPGTALRAAGS